MPSRDEPPPMPVKSKVWPLWLAALGVVWMVLIRVPLVLNAGSHLDSDLAVDGIAVADLIQGHAQWHFPGTPHIGIAPAVFAAPQIAVWGLNPITLVSGGVVAYVTMALAVFWLAWTAFGARVAAWSLVPLAFASTGLIWLSGRITGGHLLAGAWHAGSMALLYRCLVRGGAGHAATLGLWCGLGLWHDSLLLLSVASVVVAGCLGWAWSGGPRSGLVPALAFAAAMGVGVLPREIGRRLDPYDAYREQLTPLTDPAVLGEHASILGLQCVPRLIAGHRIDRLDLPSEPLPGAVQGSKLRPSTATAGSQDGLVGWATTLLALSLFAAALLVLGLSRTNPPDLARNAVRVAMGLSSGLVVVGFLLNRNIFNSDNYRYLVFLVVPWAVGFGAMMDALARKGRGGALLAGGLAGALAVLMTVDTARWYERFGWIDRGLRPVRVPVREPALDWLEAHPDVTAISASYWDVYRLSLLTGGRVRGVPFPIYPDRFPAWSRGLPGGHPDVLLVRPSREGEPFRRRALLEGARPALVTPEMALYVWPRRASRGGT